MENGKQNYTKSKKRFLMALYVVCGLFFIGFIQFNFDTDHTNNIIASYFTLGIVAVGILIRMLKEFWAGRKKAALMELLFTVILGAVIVWALVG